MNAVHVIARLETAPTDYSKDGGPPLLYGKLLIRKQLPMMGQKFYNELDIEITDAHFPTEDLPRLMAIEGQLVSRATKQGARQMVIHVRNWKDLGPAPDISRDLDLEASGPIVG